MMDIWCWICDLPNSENGTESNSPLVFELASSEKSHGEPTGRIQVKADRIGGTGMDASVTFSVCLEGFNQFNGAKTIWISDTCPLNVEKPFLPLLLQLVEEISNRSPMRRTSTCPRSQLQKIQPEPVSWIMDSHSPESLSSFFNLLLLTRLFWLCVYDVPSEVGSLYFDSLLGPNLESLSCNYVSVMRMFLVMVGVDAELCFMRAVGYMLAKWLILRDVAVGVGLKTLAPALPRQQVGFSYAIEAHGFWVLKGYTPIWGMKHASSRDGNKFGIIELNDSVLKYALAHQQLEATIQLEYSIAFYDNYIQVNARVDNLRFHVVKLGYNKYDDMEYAEERHFVSKARVWVGPEVGATYLVGLSLGRSSENGEREIEAQKTVNVKGSSEKPKDPPKAKSRTRLATRRKLKNWRWDQDVEGSAVNFEAVMYDNVTGHDISTWKPTFNSNKGEEFRNRSNGPNRSLIRKGGLVFARDEYGEGVSWRLSRDMEGSVLKWRIGGQVWVSYWPNEVKSSYYETRCVEWCDEVDLPLLQSK